MDIVAHEVSNYFRLPYKPTPRQLLAHTTEARYRLMGGAAGSGKSVWLRWEAFAQCLAIPKWTALILRRTSKELEDNHISKMRSEMPSELATYNEQDGILTFFNGSTLRFGHLETKRDLMKYQGGEYGFCVARGTEIEMADGTFRAVEDVAVGDMVATLQGPRAVTRTPPSRRVECYRVRAGGFSVVIGSDHSLLTGAGSWAGVPSLLRGGTIRSHGASGTHGDGSQSSSEACAPSSSSRLGQPQGPEPSPRTRAEIPPLGCAASTASGRSENAASCDGLLRFPPPPAWSGLLALAAPLLPSKESDSRPGSLLRVPACGPSGPPSGEDSGADCRGEHDSRGGPPLPGEAADPERTPSPSGAAAAASKGLRWDGQGSTPEHILVETLRYSHPYTRAHAVSSRAVHLVPFDISPVGEGEVFDLTVAGASQYISRGGFVSQNCGFDEQTQFTFDEFVFLTSRNRNVNGRPNMAGATNPGGVGHVWTRSLWIDKKPFNGWPATGYVPEHFAYIPARVYDNPYLMEANPEYEEYLRNLPEAMRAAYLDGSWDLVAGQYFDCWNLSQHVDFSDRVESPPWCERNIGIDWGFSHNSAVEWGVTDERAETLTVYRELVAPRMTPEQLGESIVALTPQSERSRIANIYLSHDAHELRKEEFSIADQLGAVLAKNGLPWPQNARSSRVAGWVHMYEMLRAGQLKIHKSCQNLIGMMPELQRDPDCSDDVLKVDGDDAPDALRYLIQNRWGTGNPPFEVQVGRNFAALEETHGKAKDMNQVYIRQLMAKAQARKTVDRPFSLDRGGPKARGRRAGAWRFSR